jgi:gallate decarboxylase subunit D
MKRFVVAVREGRFRLEALVASIGPDLLVAVWGGTHPHIGAVALALPRPSLQNRRKTSATSSVLTLLGHKEDVTAKVVSESLSAALKQNVVVTAGIHWDNLRPEEIGAINELTNKLIGKITAKVEAPEPRPSPPRWGKGSN